MPSDPYAVRYDPLALPETGHVEEYKILEISAELAKIIEQAERDGEEGVRSVFLLAFPPVILMLILGW
jgi:hypothetical protein